MVWREGQICIVLTKAWRPQSTASGLYIALVIQIPAVTALPVYSTRASPPPPAPPAQCTRRTLPVWEDDFPPLAALLSLAAEGSRSR